MNDFGGFVALIFVYSRAYSYLRVIKQFMYATPHPYPYHLFAASTQA